MASRYSCCVPWRVVPAGVFALLGVMSLLLGAMGVAEGWAAAMGAFAAILLAATSVLMVQLSDMRREADQTQRTLRRLNRRVVRMQRLLASRSDADAPAGSPPSSATELVAVEDRPSFSYQYKEYLRIVEALRDDLGVSHPLWDIEDKLKGYRFADRHGIDRPRVLGVYDDVGSLLWDALPDDFVIKPRRGASNMGVLALTRTGSRTFWDVMRARTWNVVEVDDYLSGLAASRRVSGELLVEELIWAPHGHGMVPRDWKVLCFGGSVQVVIQRDLRQRARSADWRFKYWDRDFAALGPVKDAARFDPDLPPPADPPGLIAFAERAARMTRLPFLRVDVFESSRGLLLGEFTPLPGGQIYSAAMDVHLGRVWEHVEARRWADDVASGQWDHLRVADDEAALVCAGATSPRLVETDPR